MTESRLWGADFVRAAACLTVLLHHLTQRLDSGTDFGPVLNSLRIFAQMGAFGVAMFFVLSGFLLARPFWTAFDAGKPMPSLKTYALRRAARILPGYWLALAVSFVLSIALFGVALDGELVLRLVAGFLLIADWHWLTIFPVEINGPLWSICFEITAYVLLPLAFFSVFAGGRFARGWLGRLVFAVMIAVTLGLHWPVLKYYPIDGIRRSWDFGLVGGAKYWMPRYNPFALFAMFAFGALAAGIQVRLAALRHWAFDLLALLAVGAAIFVLNHHLWLKVDPSGFGWLGIPYSFPWFQLSVAVFLAVVPSTQVLGRLLDNGPVRFLATISFGIYIWHNVVIELVRLGWAPGFYYGNITDGVEFSIVAGTIAAISLLCGWLSWRWVEKPVIGWARAREKAGAVTPRVAAVHSSV
jgi:peptidoglycan/LPS O-acetylase OafA/YrhL